MEYVTDLVEHMRRSSFDEMVLEVHDSLVYIGRQLSSVTLYPWIELLNFTLLCHTIRNENRVVLPRHITGSTRLFALRHPVSSYVSSMLLCFAGPILCALLDGRSPLVAFANNRVVLLASIIWYLTNFCPFDLYHRITCTNLGIITIIFAKEVLRLHRLDKAVTHGLATMGKNYLGVVIYAQAMSSGCIYMRQLIRVLGSRAQFGESCVLRPRVLAKASLCITVVMMAVKVGVVDTRSVDRDLAFFVAYLLLVICSIVQFTGTTSVFAWMENLVCGVLFGGLVDVLLRREDVALKVNEVATAATSNPSGDAAGVGKQPERVKSVTKSKSKLLGGDQKENRIPLKKIPSSSSVTASNDNYDVDSGDTDSFIPVLKKRLHKKKSTTSTNKK